MIFGGILPFIGFKTIVVEHDCGASDCPVDAVRVEGFAIGWFGQFLWIRATVTPMFLQIEEEEEEDEDAAE